MNDLSQLTFIELYKLNNQVGIEILKRIWPIFPIFIVIYGLLVIKDKRNK